MTNFTIVRVTPDMAPGLERQFSEWSRKACINYPQLSEHAQGAAEFMSQFDEDASSYYYVAYRGTTLEGAIQIRDRPDRRTILSLFSNPQNLIEKKKAGVGIALIKHVTQEIVCRKEPVPLTVKMCTSNTAVSYYTKLGFQPSLDLCAHTLSVEAMKTDYVSLRYLSCGDRLYYGTLRAAKSAFDFLDWYTFVSIHS
jgi:hypothetical protein